MESCARLTLRVRLTLRTWLTLCARLTLHARPTLHSRLTLHARLSRQLIGGIAATTKTMARVIAATTAKAVAHVALVRGAKPRRLRACRQGATDAT
ncbi:hypothetical protein T492DRAFT_1008958, partial [Pavlovales sp. CCMP2436]